MRPSELEHNLQTLVDAKVINLDVSLATLVKGGALSADEPWDIFCGNGWIFRRRGPIGPRLDLDAVRTVVRDELARGGLKGG